MSAFQRWLRDSAERVALTFIETFVAVLLGSGPLDIPHLRDASAWQAAALAGLAAAVATVKVIFAKYVGSGSSASLDPGQP